jgi:hypothetical protein
MKLCTKCNQQKDESLFNKNKSKKDGLQTKCRECDRKRALKIYQSDPLGKEKALVRKHKARELTREKMLQFLQGKCCKTCQENDPVVLDFDHRDAAIKTANVSEMVGTGLSWNKILAEIEKCDILCSNCHRRKTARELGFYKCLLS